jgi:hypothetical protein
MQAPKGLRLLTLKHYIFTGHKRSTLEARGRIMRILSMVTISYTAISLRSAKPILEKTQQNHRPHYGGAFFMEARRGMWFLKNSTHYFEIFC